MSDFTLKEPLPHLELAGWEEGRVLSLTDIKMLREYLKQIESDIENQMDEYIAGREDALLEVGGEALLKAVNEESLARMEQIIGKALATYEVHKAQRKKETH